MLAQNRTKRWLQALVITSLSGLCATGFGAEKCEHLSVSITNNSSYDWYLDESQSSPVDDVAPKVLKAGQVTTFQQNSTDYWESLQDAKYTDLFGEPYQQTLVYYVKTANGDGSRPYYFQIYLSYAPCQWPNVCTSTSKSNPGSVDASANVDADSANIVSVADGDDDGNTGSCPKYTKKAGVWVPTGKFTSQDDGNADFTIEQPKALGLQIALPFQHAPTIKNQSFLQQTFNNLDPAITSQFDYTLSNPLDEATDTFNFNLPCTSEACNAL